VSGEGTRGEKTVTEPSKGYAEGKGDGVNAELIRLNAELVRAKFGERRLEN
jgi:hypothetical protein